MIKQQNIFFHPWLDFNINGGGIIENDTETLNLFFRDNNNNNSLCLIGDSLEWKPNIWIQFEQEKIEKLKEINIVCLLGDLTEFFHYCQKKFINVKINYHQYNLYDQISSIKQTFDSLDNKIFLPAQGERTANIYCSTGTMRLNRYILIKEGQDKGYDFYHPSISYNLSKDFEYQLSRCLSTAMQQPTALKQKTLFTEELTPFEFDKKQIPILSDSYINFIATFPNTDWLKDKEDEKYFNAILCKTVPFMLCEKHSNTTGVDLLGFLPYVGFDFKADCIDNPVLRWKSLLQDNEHIFKDKQRAKELYEKNQRVIDHNYNRLVNTDWEAERLAQFDKLPTFIKEGLKYYELPPN